MIDIINTRKLARKLLKEGLSPNLSYHNYQHTCTVVKNALFLARKEKIIDQMELKLLETAAWFHDAGFINVYFEHEEESCRIIRKLFPDLGVNDFELEKICNLIRATKVPQNPKNLLEEILCDADLYYLGSSAFFETSQRLKQEWFHFGIINNSKEFEEKQLKFLNLHHFFTETAKAKRNPLKFKILEELSKNEHKNLTA